MAFFCPLFLSSFFSLALPLTHWAAAAAEEAMMMMATSDPPGGNRTRGLPGSIFRHRSLPAEALRS